MGLDSRVTTGDHWFRTLERRKIQEILEKIENKKNILDIGCGDGRTIIALSQKFPDCNFFGIDNAELMIENAKKLSDNVEFQILDMQKLNTLNRKFDVIISDRALINLPNRKSQEETIKKIVNSLTEGGHYLMIENFIEGHNEMNRLRCKLKLKKIPIHWYSAYFDEAFAKEFILKHFSIIKRENISSLYYLITKVVYSKICQLEKREPDYDNIIYKVITDLNESMGNYGATNLFLLRAKTPKIKNI